MGRPDDVFCPPACPRPLLLLLQVTFHNFFLFSPNTKYMCSLIDLMGKSMTKKVGQMMWCGSYQNNRKTLDRVQQRSSPKLLSEYMILLREPFHVKFLDLFQLIHLILSKPHPLAPLYIGLICCFSCVTFLHCVIVNAPSMCPITSNWSHIYMLFLF